MSDDYLGQLEVPLQESDMMCFGGGTGRGDWIRYNGALEGKAEKGRRFTKITKLKNYLCDQRPFNNLFPRAMGHT